MRIVAPRRIIVYMFPTPVMLSSTPVRTPIARGTALLTDRIIANSSLTDRVAAFTAGWTGDAVAIADARTGIADARAQYGFVRKPVAILTPPDANSKLDKGAVKAYGLTLQSHVTQLSTGERVNACPWAGHCVKVCVLNNGSGRYASVQRARDYRTEFFATNPLAALTLIGAELATAVRKYGAVTFRPNVNSDLDWYAILADTLRNLDGVTSYGYSKNDPIAATGLSHYAYSWNESTEPASIDTCRALHIPVAAVTNRKPGEPIAQWAPGFTVVDADLTDEWMIDAVGPTIGDLSAKGKARGLIGRKARGRHAGFGRFVQSVY